jgi:hypothetical protein
MESYIKAYYPKSSLVIYKLLEMYGQSDLVNTTQTNPYGHVPNGIRLSNYTTETLCIRQWTFDIAINKDNNLHALFFVHKCNTEIILHFAKKNENNISRHTFTS